MSRRRSDQEQAAELAELRRLVGERVQGATGATPQPNGPPPPAPRPAPKASPTPEPLYDCICMADVQPRAIEWLWPDKLAYGKISLIAGDGDLGKSWAMLDVAARLSTATPLPGESGRPAPTGSVLLMGEDDAADTIRPRLDAQRADVGRIHLLRGVRRGGSTAIVRLQRDIAVVEAALRDKGARLLVIDGLASYMSGTDGINEIEVRSVLLPLSEMAQRCGAAVIAIMHRNKGQHSNPLHAIAGSVAFGNVARCVLGVANDPQAPGRRVMVPIKGNIIREEKGVGYRIHDFCLSWDNDPVTITKQTIFLGESASGQPDDGEDLQAGRVAEGVQVLQTILIAHGGSAPSEIVEQEAKRAGIPARTLDRARPKLGVKAVRRTEEKGVVWYMELPDRGSHE